MQGIDLTKPGEKKKMLIAGGLGLLAILFLWWTFFGFGSSAPQRAGTTPSAKPTPARQTPKGPGATDGVAAETLIQLTDELNPIILVNHKPDARETDRNIFAYYEPPKPSPVVSVATPTPTPPPPLLLATISPASVYARTGDFPLELSGDKFTRDLKIYFDGREVPTKYLNPQQLSTTVPASMITNPGSHDVSVQSSDGKLYSAKVPLNVAAPPVPNYSYIGMYSTNRHVDTAMLQDKSNREVTSYQRGEVVGGRFRITSISEKELVLIDTALKIKHSLAMSEGDRAAGSPISRPTPKVDAEDDEP